MDNFRHFSPILMIGLFDKQLRHTQPLTSSSVTQPGQATVPYSLSQSISDLLKSTIIVILTVTVCSAVGCVFFITFSNSKNRVQTMVGESIITSGLFAGSQVGLGALARTWPWA